jgi:hypothetical protein
MKSGLATAWERFWFRPAGPAGLLATRAILCGNALWILLSRPGLPDLFSWPAAFWRNVPEALKVRFLIFGLSPAIEKGLFVLLLLLLVTAACGIAPRLSCLAGAVLLYHFAPLEDIFASQGGPFFRGLTLPVLGLFLLGFAQIPRRGAAPSAELRWPLAAIQVACVFTYLLSGLSKLISVGPDWASPANFEGLVLGLMLPEVSARWAHLFVGNPMLCGLGGAGGLVMDFAPALVLWKPRYALWIVPVLVLGHLAITQIFGVHFLALPQLAVLLDWDAIADWARARRGPALPGPAPAPR